MMEKKLRRSVDDKMVAGVCGGLGEFFGIDPTLIRVLWAVSIFALGFGILPYIVCWLLIPVEETEY